MRSVLHLLCGVVALLATQSVVHGESVFDKIDRRLETDYQVSLHPLQKPAIQAPFQKEAQLQAPIQKDFALQAPIQVPSKASASLVLSAGRACTLIPGRARRVARRAERARAAEVNLALRGRTLLEAGPTGRTMLESSACSTASCAKAGSTFTLQQEGAIPGTRDDSVDDMPVVLTSLTTRELLEGGTVNTRGRIVQEPGICGGGGSCSSGGRRGLFRR